MYYLQGSKLGPGTYNFKSFAEETIGKVTSNRGPYDLFSGDRNKPITVGYLAAPVRPLNPYIRGIYLFYTKREDSEHGALDGAFKIWFNPLCLGSFWPES